MHIPKLIIRVNNPSNFKMKLVILAVLASTVAAFAPNAASQRMASSLAAENTDRRAFLNAALATSAAVVAASPAGAIRDYEAIGYLGGSDKVDLNNANVRVYLKMPGMYPAVAGKIVSHGPYASVGDVYKIDGLTGGEKEVLKKYESRFVVTAPSPDYVIDRINNGL
mmetsp:Transcript_33627/g.77604  ORF Transcript_33627/g.77604 Transcript_33627/m.77604 type:complete len:167 (+) Transcript_33627:86-586(+)